MNIKFITEGVFILASASKLREECRDKEFNYNFPEGIADLLEHNTIIALTTSDGDNIELVINKPGERLTGDYDKVITQWIELQANDELLILSHAEFTQICDLAGDYKTYGLPVEKLEIKQGLYKIAIGVEDFSDNFDEINAYLRLTIFIVKAETGKPNHVQEAGLG